MLEFANMQDLPFIVEIYNSTVKSRMVTADTHEISVESRLEWFQQHNNEKYPIMVIRDNDKNQIKAWVSLSQFYGRSAFDATAEISLYIHADYRNQKLGSQIINEVKAMMPKLKITTLLAFVFSHNIPSMNLFQKHQFKTWGEMPYIAKMDGKLYSLSILGFKL